jgi:hypothetical protein
VPWEPGAAVEVAAAAEGAAEVVGVVAAGYMASRGSC